MNKQLEKLKTSITAAEKKLLDAQQKLGNIRQQQATVPASDTYAPVGKLYSRFSSGRRRALAEWVTSSKNPLAARVAVNHIWLRHMGRALVPTVFNFGLGGKPPSHTKLLDWLAVELMESGWSMKHFHRLIVTSATYRMSSLTHDPNLGSETLDPDNIYLWRMNSRRMEAEVVRGAVLCLSGQLELTMGGPELEEGDGETSGRRSLYFRHTPDSQVQFLTLFDAANASECYQRNESVVPQQALAMKNSVLSQSQARLLARRLDDTVLHQEGTSSGR